LAAFLTKPEMYALVKNLMVTKTKTKNKYKHKKQKNTKTTENYKHNVKL